MSAALKLRNLPPLSLALLTLWFLLSIVSLVLVALRAGDGAQAHLQREADRMAQQLSGHLRDNEAVIDGFSSFLAASGVPEEAALRRYARTMLDRYPHIYGLEIAQRVERKDLERFENMMRKRSHPDFQVRSFNYEQGRTWESIKNKNASYPIVFVHPLSAATEQVLGLDLDSVPHLRRPLAEAALRNNSVSSRPFELIEGGLAYVLYRRVPAGDSQMQPAGSHLFALLVFKASSLLRLDPDPWVSVEVRVDDVVFFSQAANPAGDLESWLLPERKTEIRNANNAQPVSMTFSRQVRWSDLPLAGLIAVGLVSIASLAMLSTYLGQYHLSLQLDRQHRDDMARMALHDSLTGLPNRSLLADRFAQAVHSAQRNKRQVGILFVDLDKFKAVNDRLGHEAGDLVLIEIANRLRACLRDGDTVCRLGGDEFVVLLPDMAEPFAAQLVAKKIFDALQTPHRLSLENPVVTASVGISVFPGDGTSLDVLIREADQAMYRVKSDGSPVPGQAGAAPAPHLPLV